MKAIILTTHFLYRTEQKTPNIWFNIDICNWY